MIYRCWTHWQGFVSEEDRDCLVVKERRIDCRQLITQKLENGIILW